MGIVYKETLNQCLPLYEELTLLFRKMAKNTILELYVAVFLLDLLELNYRGD
jgi:hypothetical protein